MSGTQGTRSSLGSRSVPGRGPGAGVRAAGVLAGGMLALTGCGVGERLLWGGDGYAVKQATRSVIDAAAAGEAPAVCDGVDVDLGEPDDWRGAGAGEPERIDGRWHINVEVREGVPRGGGAHAGRPRLRRDPRRPLPPGAPAGHPDRGQSGLTRRPTPQPFPGRGDRGDEPPALGWPPSQTPPPPPPATSRRCGASSSTPSPGPSSASSPRSVGASWPRSTPQTAAWGSEAHPTGSAEPRPAHGDLRA